MLRRQAIVGGKSNVSERGSVGGVPGELGLAAGAEAAAVEEEDGRAGAVALCIFGAVDVELPARLIRRRSVGHVLLNFHLELAGVRRWRWLGRLLRRRLRRCLSK
jgi:hypothetical protein